MTIAELHGKISSSGSNLHDRLEDLLTSDVFGGLLYAARWEVLEGWLTQATNIDRRTLGQVLPGLRDIEGVTMAFWPTGGSLGREPDVVLGIETRAGGKYGLCVEAKYLSGKSNRPDEVEEEGPGIETILPGDQLAAQWAQICKKIPPGSYPWRPDVPVDNRALVFVTGHAVQPRDDLEESLRNNQDPNVRDKCFWLGWSQLHHVLEDHLELDTRASSGPGRVLADLLKLLNRKGLRFFQGYAHCVAEFDADPSSRVHGVFWNERFFDFLAGENEIALQVPVFWSDDNG